MSVTKNIVGLNRYGNILPIIVGLITYRTMELFQDVHKPIQMQVPHQIQCFWNLTCPCMLANNIVHKKKNSQIKLITSINLNVHPNIAAQNKLIHADNFGGLPSSRGTVY